MADEPPLVELAEIQQRFDAIFARKGATGAARPSCFGPHRGTASAVDDRAARVEGLAWDKALRHQIDHADLP